MPARPGDDLLDRVAALVREVSAEAIEPRFEALAEGDVREKSPGELVTIADEEAERLLTAGLAAILPGVPVVGEEACAVDPGLLARAAEARAWVVDPVDGTGNFVARSPDWAVMVALLEGGETVASWIWRPTIGTLYRAERGGGAWRDGTRLRIAGAAAGSGGAAALEGAVMSRYLPAAERAAFGRERDRFGRIFGGRGCAGIEYPDVVEGRRDFAVFWRTLPWDHAPGSLLVEEAGGVVQRPDGSPYRPADGGVGLVVARSEEVAAQARTLLGRASA